MDEIHERRQYKILNNAISILAVLCCGDRDTTIDILTGYLWDKEEAKYIKCAMEGD